ncbi:hypothetical protein GCM10020000_40160 [Streptomyces olivoverticillatus]
MTPSGFHIRDGWSKFYRFSQERPIDFGSVWLFISQRTGNPLDDANVYAELLMLLGCLGIAALGLCAPRRPRFAQLAFLVIALFILVNKVYSPQYVLWLVPLAALARPKWRDFLVWQACEVLYYLGIWFYLAYTGSGDKHQGLPPEGYQLAIVLHLLGTLYLCAIVVRDILKPERDVVRRDGSDDPSGGPPGRGAGHIRLRPRAPCVTARGALGRGTCPVGHREPQLVVRGAGPLPPGGISGRAPGRTAWWCAAGGPPARRRPAGRERRPARRGWRPACAGGSANQRCLPAQTNGERLRFMVARPARATPLARGIMPCSAFGASSPTPCEVPPATTTR